MATATITFGPKLNRLINAPTGSPYTDQLRPFLRAFDELVMGAVLSNTITTPPALPNNGDAYIVGSGATGLWLGYDNMLAVYSTEITLVGTDNKVPGWEFLTPKEGWQLWVASISQATRFTGGVWTTAQSGFMDEEVPYGTIDGTNTTFALSHTPNPISSYKLYLGGQRMKRDKGDGNGGDYTLNGTQLVYYVAPPLNVVHVADYRY